MYLHCFVLSIFVMLMKDTGNISFFQLCLVVSKIEFKFSLAVALHQSDKGLPGIFGSSSGFRSLSCQPAVCHGLAVVVVVSKC